MPESWNPMNWFKAKPQQAPKLTRGQQELQDFRAHKAGEVQRQVQADAKAGGKAMRQQAKPKPKPPGVKGPVKPSAPKGGSISGAGAALMVDGLLESSGAYNFITEGAVDGAAMLMGASPAQRQQALNIQRGVPTVRSHKGVSYNINDPKQNAAYQKALAGGGGGGSTRQMADIRGSETPGSDKPADTNRGEGEAMDAAEEFRPGAGYPGGIERPADYPTRNQEPPNPNPDPTVPASGTITGGSRSALFDMDRFMTDIGNPQGVNLRNPFSSGQLPATADHAAALKMTPGEFETQLDTGGVVKTKSGKYVKTSDLNNDNEGAIKTDGLNMNATAGEVDAFYGTAGNKADSLEGERVLTPDQSDETSPINWANRTMADNSDERMRARAAILDPNVGTMEGLRRAEGEMGMVVQNGRYATKDADGNVVELTKEGYRRRMNGEEASQEFLDKYRTKVTQAAAETIQETSEGLAPAGVDDNVIYSIDGEELDSPISTAEYNKRFPNDNK